jgi:N-acetyl-anhydromuramyl-L-alanine amidase AmpD
MGEQTAQTENFNTASGAADNNWTATSNALADTVTHMKQAAPNRAKEIDDLYKPTYTDDGTGLDASKVAKKSEIAIAGLKKLAESNEKELGAFKSPLDGLAKDFGGIANAPARKGYEGMSESQLGGGMMGGMGGGFMGILVSIMQFFREAMDKFKGMFPEFAESQNNPEGAKMAKEAKAAIMGEQKPETAATADTAKPNPTTAKIDTGAVKVESGNLIAEKLKIDSRYDASLPFAKTATEHKEAPSGIVMHVSAKHTLGEQEAYMSKPDPERGGQYGYHFLIDKDGAIVQTAPLDKRTNHIKPDIDNSYSNANSIGIAMIDSQDGATEAQKQSAAYLTVALQNQYGIADNRIVGHGDIQTDRQHGLGKEEHNHGAESADVIAYIRDLNRATEVASNNTPTNKPALG